MSLLSRLWWMLFFGTLLYLFFIFLGAAGLVPLDRGSFLSDFGFAFVFVLIFLELTSFKL